MSGRATRFSRSKLIGRFKLIAQSKLGSRTSWRAWLLFIICLLPASVLAKGEARQALIDVKLVAPSRDSAEALPRRSLIVYARSGSEWRAYVDAAMLNVLRQEGFKVEVLSSDYADRVRTMVRNSATRDSAYLDVADLATELQSIAALSPHATVEVLGHSVEQRPILGLRVGASSEHRTSLRMLGAHHGDERPSLDFVLALARDYTSHLSEEDAQRLSVLFVPAVNPDGVVAATRHNAHGVDLNRNYNYGFNSSEYASGEHAFSEPEVSAIALDNEHHRYALSLTFHTGALNIGYPWNYTRSDMKEEALLRDLAQGYRALVPLASFDVLRGAKWYISYGDTNDYSFGHYGGIDLTVEMAGPEKTPPAGELASLISAQMPAAKEWLALGHHIKRVRVLDAMGRSIPARVWTSRSSAVVDELTGIASLWADADEDLSVFAAGFAEVKARASQGDAILDLVMTPNADAGLGRAVEQQGNELRVRGVTAESVTVSAFRPGEAVQALTCSRDGTEVWCAVPSAPVRPGAYTVLVQARGGATVAFLRALYVTDERAAHATLDPTKATLTYLISDNGKVIWPSPSSLPLGDEGVPAGTRQLWTENGILFSSPVGTTTRVSAVDEVSAAAPSPSQTTTSSVGTSANKRRGCSSSGQGSLGLVWAAALLVLRQLVNRQLVRRFVASGPRSR